MAFKGFNSILFDFYSLVDIKLSLMKFLSEYAKYDSQYKDNCIDYFNSNLMLVGFNEWKSKRIQKSEDIFKSILKDELKDKSDEIFKELLNKFEVQIYSKYLQATDLSNLISAYKKAGNGVIKTAVRCNTKLQRDYIESKYNGCVIDFGERKNIDMGKYARLIVGYYIDALEYTLEEPKSILILDFKENFEDNDITLLKPELVINLGDVNDISVVSAYRN